MTTAEQKAADLARAIELSDLEREARAIVYAIRQEPWAEGNQLVAMVFGAQPLAALPTARINRVAAALSGYDSCDLQETLTRLARKKFLRSRRHHAQTLYELNLKG